LTNNSILLVFIKNFIVFNFVRYLQYLIPVENIKIFKNEIILIVIPEILLKIIEFLKLHTSSQYKMLTCISGTDYPEYSNRFEVVYELMSLVYNHRLRIKIYVNELIFVSSLTSLFPSANWWEREIWDLFGIYFVNHPDLRRILTDYGFEGYPLKKCFPLTGYVEVRYNENQKRVFCEPIKQLTQEFKFFKFSSPWKN